MGSNKFGKTTIGTAEVISYALGYRPFLKKDDPNYLTPFKPPVKIRIIGEDFVNHIGKVLVPTRECQGFSSPTVRKRSAVAAKAATTCGSK